jgi:hypothetical protein
MPYTDEEKISLFRNVINNIKKEIILNKPRKSPEEAARILLNLHRVLTGVIRRKRDFSSLKENKLEGVFDDIINDTMSSQLADQVEYYCNRDLLENPMAIEIKHINVQYRYSDNE